MFEGLIAGESMGSEAILAQLLLKPVGGRKVGAGSLDAS